MRVTILSLAIIAAGLLGATQTPSAQNAYNYPWCSITNATGRVLDGGLGGGSGPQCYYQTYEQCMATNWPQDGNCYPNTEYRPFPGGLPPLAVDTTARTVESYRWCAISANAAEARDCYYDTLEDCKTTMTGIIGNCYPSPYYRPPAAAAARAGNPSVGRQLPFYQPPAAAAPPPAAAPRRPVAASRPVAATDRKTISAAKLPSAKSATAPAAIPAAIAATPSAALSPSGSRN
jgi:hypothetical protein